MKNLNERINITEEVIYDCTTFQDEKVILENQLVIMETLLNIQEELEKIPKKKKYVSVFSVPPM